MNRLRWWLVSGAGIPWALRIGARVSSTHPTGQRACRRPANFIVAGQPGLFAIPPKGSKASRAHAVAPLVEAGQVRFHRRSDSLIEEMLAFSPRGGIDDQVDAFCQGVLWIEQRYWRGRGSSQVPVPMVFSR